MLSPSLPPIHPPRTLKTTKTYRVPTYRVPLIICSARMLCKDNEIMHNNKEKQPKSCIIRINCLTLPPKGSDYDL